MSNALPLTKVVEHTQLIKELQDAGITLGINIDGEKLYLVGEATPEVLAAQLYIATTVEAAHLPSTITEVELTAAPHDKTLRAECLAVIGVTKISTESPSSFPGTVILRHNVLSEAQKTSLRVVAQAHDASKAAYLIVNQQTTVIPADGSSTGVVTITDSRGAMAYQKTIKLFIPSEGTAGVVADSFVVDSNGQVFIPFAAVSSPTGNLSFAAYYANEEADGVAFVVRRGTP